jgi:hypothetical protein
MIRALWGCCHGKYGKRCYPWWAASRSSRALFAVPPPRGRLTSLWVDLIGDYSDRMWEVKVGARRQCGGRGEMTRCACKPVLSWSSPWASVSPERLMLLLEVVRAERSCPDLDRWFSSRLSSRCLSDYHFPWTTLRIYPACYHDQTVDDDDDDDEDGVDVCARADTTT